MIWYLTRLAAALMLLLAILPNPYSYYMLLRVIVCAVGAYSAYIAYQKKEVGWSWAFGIIAALFNPFIPVHLTKEIWMFFNLISAAVFFASTNDELFKDASKHQ
jgi:hypothetical protein